MTLSTLIGVAVIALVIGFIVLTFNRLVALRNQFKNGFAQIDVQLQRRHDLIPNLVESAKAYMGHERETLTQVMQARNRAADAQQDAAGDPGDGVKVGKLAGAENLLSRALANFYAVAENYPDLKANQTIQQLMEELSSSENRVAFARQAFNDGVMTYNTRREQFPSNVIAGFFSFKAGALLELDNAEARMAPKVSFGN